MAVMLLATKAVVIMLFHRLVHVSRGVSKGRVVGAAIVIGRLHLVTEFEMGTSVKAIGSRVRAILRVYCPAFIDVLALG